MLLSGDRLKPKFSKRNAEDETIGLVRYSEINFQESLGVVWFQCVSVGDCPGQAARLLCMMNKELGMAKQQSLVGDSGLTPAERKWHKCWEHQV